MPGHLILPYAFFSFAILVGLWFMLRRLWRLNADSDEIERAVGQGLVSPSVRKAWNRQRLVFVLGIVATLILTGLMLYGVDQILRS